MKLNKYHLMGLIVIVVVCGALLYKMNIDVANKNSVDPFSLGNAEGIQNLTDGGVEYYCKPVPKRFHMKEMFKWVIMHIPTIKIHYINNKNTHRYPLIHNNPFILD